METLTPILTFGAFPNELFDLRFSWSDGALLLDLIPRDPYYVPNAKESDAETALEDIGAQKVGPASRLLRLRFDYVDALVVSNGADMSAHALNWSLDPDDHPSISGQDFPYPLFLVEGSDWSEAVMPGVNHYRFSGPFCRADILGYEPDGEWLDVPAHS